MHDAWASYDAYLDPEHQLCRAHALREVQAVSDIAPTDADCCWATQAADALVMMQSPARRGHRHLAEAVEPEALATQIHRYRSAARIGINQTAARSDPVMRRHHALARRLIDRQAGYLRVTTDR